MKRTNDKTVIEALRIHILENFAETAGYERDNGNPTATPIDCLVSQIDYMRLPRETVYETAVHYVEGGSLLVYYAEQREFLEELLDQTDSDSEKYSDERVFNTYVHLCARTMNTLYNEALAHKLQGVN